jgi:hypothetical protein
MVYQRELMSGVDVTQGTKINSFQRDPKVTRGVTLHDRLCSNQVHAGVECFDEGWIPTAG